MKDTIYRQDALIALSKEVCGDKIWALDARDAIVHLPSAEPERKTGKWIVWGGMDVSENHGRHKCSECGEFALLRYEKLLRKEILSDYCPHCGAKMEGEADE